MSEGLDVFEVQVPVKFEGSVKVRIPSDADPSAVAVLARALVMSRIGVDINREVDAVESGFDMLLDEEEKAIAQAAHLARSSIESVTGIWRIGQEQ